KRFDGVAGDAEVDRHAAAFGNESRQGQDVRADDLVRAYGVARHDDLIARGEEGDARPAPDLEPWHVHGRRQTDLARAQPAPGLEPDRAGVKIEAGGAYVATLGRALAHHDVGAVDVDVLLDDDGVGSVRHRAAGEDPHRLARPHRPGEGAAGRRLADACEPRR